MPRRITWVTGIVMGGAMAFGLSHLARRPQPRVDMSDAVSDVGDEARLEASLEPTRLAAAPMLPNFVVSPEEPGEFDEVKGLPHAEDPEVQRVLALDRPNTVELLQSYEKQVCACLDADCAERLRSVYLERVGASEYSPEDSNGASQHSSRIARCLSRLAR